VSECQPAGHPHAEFERRAPGLPPEETPGQYGAQDIVRTSINQTDGVHSMNVRPLHDRIIVQRLEEGEQKVGGIIIPDSAKEKPQQGKVIAAGDGKVKDDGARIPLDVKAGDLILFGKYSGQEIKLDGEEYLIMREDEVLGVVEGGEKKKK
jgi:chaperonin GroES